jgi:putative membrane protein
MKNLVLFAALSFLAAPIGAHAQTTINAQQFAEKVAISDMFEIESGKLAQQKAKNAEIKKFGEQMVNDHTKTSSELKQLVSGGKVKVDLPAAMDSDHQNKLKQLQSASGDQFDLAYATQQVKAHEDAVTLFQNYSANGENADLKNWAGKTLPALKEHLAHAQKLTSAPAPTTGTSTR